MSSAPPSPAKMSQTSRTTPQKSTGAIRKRVCKACDRCRLKKSKCDGSNKCSRCKADNAICFFGERKKSHDKVYPKGYVEILEQQQSQLVTGIQEMYRRLVRASAWQGPMLPEMNGYPLTHDILAALGLLETKQDGSGESERFEEDGMRLQSKLLANGAVYVQRRGSVSLNSDHSQHNGHLRSTSNGEPPAVEPHPFRNSFAFGSTSSSSLSRSPVQRSRQSLPMTQPSLLQQSTSPSYGHPFHQPEWAISDTPSPELLLPSKFAFQQGQMMQGNAIRTHDVFVNGQIDSPIAWSEAGLGNLVHPLQSMTTFGDGMQDRSLDAQDAEYNNFIHVRI